MPFNITNVIMNLHKMGENRIIDFVLELHQQNIKSWDVIFKKLQLTFGSKFYLNRVEADYLTKYHKGELNFNTKIVNLK